MVKTSASHDSKQTLWAIFLVGLAGGFAALELIEMRLTELVDCRKGN